MSNCVVLGAWLKALCDIIDLSLACGVGRWLHGFIDCGMV
jgi:hypothetical protein